MCAVIGELCEIEKTEFAPRVKQQQQMIVTMKLHVVDAQGDKVGIEIKVRSNHRWGKIV